MFKQVRFTIGSLCLLLVLLMSASLTAAQDQATVTLRFSWWGNDTRSERTQKVIEMFQQANPGIVIEGDAQPTFNDYWIALESQGEGKNLPDIVQHDYSRVSDWVSKGWLLPLDSFVQDKTIDLSSVSEDVVASGTINKKLYAVSMGSNAPGIILDVDAFAKAGIPLPKQTWTWADFEKICTEIHDKLSISCVESGNLTGYVGWENLWLGYGKTAFSADGKSLGYTDNKPYVDYLNMMLRLQESGAKKSFAEEKGGQGDTLADATAAMGGYWSNGLVGVWTKAGEKRHFVMTHMPRPSDGCCSSTYIKPSQFMTISANSAHPKEAAQFINYMTNSLEANRVLLGERGVPVSSVVSNDLKAYVTPAQAESFDFIARVTKDRSPLPPPYTSVEISIRDKVLPDTLTNIMFGEVTPEEGMAKFDADATALLGGTPQ